MTVHRAVVAGDTPSRITLDVAPISGDLVAAIAVAEPTLGRVLAGRTLDVGSVTLANGTAVEPALRAVRSARRVRRLPPLAFGAAAVLFALALLVAERRRKAVGRVARALLGAAAGLFLLGYAVPYLVSRAAFEASAGAFAGEILAKLFSGWPVVVIPTAGLGIAMLLGLALTRTPGRS